MLLHAPQPSEPAWQLFSIDEGTSENADAGQDKGPSPSEGGAEARVGGCPTSAPKGDLPV